MQNTYKHVESTFIGLDRKVTFYAADGTVIREWQGRFKVEDRGGSCYFIVDGKTVVISGTFLVEEK